MGSDAPSFSSLETLATSLDVRDRAFAASALWLRHRPETHTQVAPVYERVRETASSVHAKTRAGIRDGTLDRRALFDDLRTAPIDIRDHLAEEILDIAYPPLERAPQRDVIGYAASGIAEILFMLDQADLAPGRTFVDLGSGLGKVVLLVALLTGAAAYGIESDLELASRARLAASNLGIATAQFVHADLLEGAIVGGDVYYMYIPFVGSAGVTARLEAVARARPILLFSQKLELRRFPWLRARNASSYWLEAYESVDS